jgi:hypothetical protein
MYCQGSMAGFTVYVGMFALRLHVQNIGVTGFAGLVAGKFDGMRSNFADGGAAIVPILAKASGNNIVARHQKHQKGQDK